MNAIKFTGVRKTGRTPRGIPDDWLSVRYREVYVRIEDSKTKVLHFVGRLVEQPNAAIGGDLSWQPCWRLEQACGFMGAKWPPCRKLAQAKDCVRAWLPREVG